MSSYQVIARKWRPQSFDQLVGQPHISQTLTNALKNGRMPHALLFTGPRGTGKTTSARIMAKSLRCQNAKDFVPCNHCVDCEEINQGRSVDVMEIDGASNNGVDAIRELRDAVAFMPSRGKFKVYIIDEVHMLSTSAFNALLKTLEEPPDHVVFIMATTEAHKIPQTILSRCQRFDFRSISTRQITDHLKRICQTDNVQAEEEALWIIARQGDGSMRDSQSLLDQVITFANGPLTRERVVAILGLTDRTLLLETLAGLVQRDTAAILKILEKIQVAGYEPGLFAQDLLEVIRNLLLIRLSPDLKNTIIELPDSEVRFLNDLGTQTTNEDVHMLFDMALKGASDIPRAQEPRLVLEMALLRMASAPQIADIQAILKGNVQLPAASPTATPRATASASSPGARGPSESTVTKHRVDAVGLNPQDKWFDLVQKIKSADALFAAKIEGLTFNGLKEKTLELGVPKKLSFLKDQMSDADNRKKLQSFVDQHWGQGFMLMIQLGETSAASPGVSAKAIADKKEQEREEDIAKRVANHPQVKSAQAVFKGQIKGIKDPDTKPGGRRV